MIRRELFRAVFRPRARKSKRSSHDAKESISAEEDKRKNAYSNTTYNKQYVISIHSVSINTLLTLTIKYHLVTRFFKGD